MAQTTTKKRILDAAEKLFARQGFHATSMRMLTKEAGVNLAAVNYHFGSKVELIKAVS
jgi:AcrR family transcriptional regulator